MWLLPGFVGWLFFTYVYGGIIPLELVFTLALFIALFALPLAVITDIVEARSKRSPITRDWTPEGNHP